MLRADAEANGRGCDVLLLQLFGSHLRMRGRIRVNHKALHVGHVGKQREDFERVDKLPCRLFIAFYLKRENATAAVGEIFIVKGVVGVRRQRGMVHAAHLRVGGEELHHLQGILNVPLHAQRQRFQTLQQDKGIERGNRRACVAQDDGTNACYESRRTCHVGKHRAVIGGVGLGERGILVGLRLPVERAAVHNHAAEARAVAAYELRGTVHHHIGAVLNGANQERRAEGIVHHERHTMLVRHGSHCVKVRNIGVRVAERFGIHHLSIGHNGSIEGIEVVHVENGERNALRCQRVRNQVERTAVEVIGSHDVVARSEEILQGIGHSRRAARHSQGSHAALQGRHAFLEDRLSGISEAAIDIARITQRKAVGCML